MRASHHGLNSELTRLLARDLERIGIPAQQARMFAKKFALLAPGSKKVYGKVAARKVSKRRALSPGVVSIVGRKMDRLAVRRTEGGFIVEPLRARPTRVSASRRARGELAKAK